MFVHNTKNANLWFQKVTILHENRYLIFNGFKKLTIPVAIDFWNSQKI